MEIVQASVTDAEEILKLQKLAYQIEAERYNDYNIPPLKQTIEEINPVRELRSLTVYADGGFKPPSAWKSVTTD